MLPVLDVRRSTYPEPDISYMVASHLQGDCAWRGGWLRTYTWPGPVCQMIWFTASRCWIAYIYSACFGLVPRQHSTGGHSTLCGISKRGDRHLRYLLVQCAHAVMHRATQRTDRLGEWIRSMQARRHPNVVACAIANKLARIAWAVLTKHTAYDASRLKLAD